ncbi:HPr kinase/phosphorylase [Shimia sp.]|jgi:HPr kinase/phosphorylase|uniref:HPr kinase/phosphorylase n=1 Tax=unclassified Shimia TaxID=2630038 RepID=UPI0025EFA927|nr:HPr kinase/phosphatase C-terminal domain-containing protein [Shimia sp.]MCH2069528.1 HPr kinase/phosphatase C-terminal domain-containing protein [Shimia sp.]
MTQADDLFSAQSDIAVEETLLHASCVADDGRAVLIRGAAGRGKSSLALQLMAYGAELVSDDQTVVRLSEGRLLASAPDTTRGLIEARSVGILRANPVQDIPLHLVIDLDQTEDQRLPHPRQVQVLGQELPMLLGVDAPYFAAAVLQLLRHGRNA